MLLDELLDERLVRIGLGHNTSLMDIRRGALLESNFEFLVSRGPTPALRPARVFISVAGECTRWRRYVKVFLDGDV